MTTLTINTVRGHDITDIVRGVIVHGCNCKGAMNSGVAKSIRDKWPQVYAPYKKAVDNCISYGNSISSLLGGFTCIAVDYLNEILVVNGFTQVNYGYDKAVYADAEAISKVLHSAITVAHTSNLPLHTVRIGTDRGGLELSDWNTALASAIEDWRTSSVLGEVAIVLTEGEPRYDPFTINIFIK